MDRQRILHEWLLGALTACRLPRPFWPDNRVASTRCAGQGHGKCIGRFCHCAHGWHGHDCSLHIGRQPPTSAFALGARVNGTATQLRFVPTFVYPLPSYLSLEHVYQVCTSNPTRAQFRLTLPAVLTQRDEQRRGQYYANLRFLEQLLRRRDAVVADPEEAPLPHSNMPAT